MRLTKNALWIALLVVISSCHSRGPTSYYVSGIQVDRNGHVLPIGSRSLFEPNSAPYFWFFHAATGLTTVRHFEKKPGTSKSERVLYLEANRDGLLDRTVKSDVLFSGDFGIARVQRTCFYNRPLQSNFSSVSVGFDSNGYPSAFEDPTVLPGTPNVVPPLSSVSFLKVLRNDSDYTLVSADYEATGELRSFQVVRSKDGTVSPTTDVVSYRLNSRDPRLDKYGIPSRLDIGTYLSSHRLQLPSSPAPEQSVWLIQFYDFGKLIHQQQLKRGIPISARWLQPSVTEEEHIIGPECDSRFFQQRSQGLPTTGY